VKNKSRKPLWAVLLIIGMMGWTGPACAGEAAGDSDWKFGAELYLWGASIGGTAFTGKNIEVEFDDIIDKLEFAFMGAFAAHKGKWTFLTDVIYMDVSDSNDLSPGVEATADLTTWVVTPMVGYNVIQEGMSRLDLLGGARYLSVEPSITVDPPGGGREESQSVWDAVVGARGVVDVAKNLFLVGVLDVGAGDSDLTWQALGGIGYRFKHFSLVAAYRYMAWDLADAVKMLDDLEIHGPGLGFQFAF